MTRVWLRRLPQLLDDMLTQALAREAGVKLLSPTPDAPTAVLAPDVVIGSDDPADPTWAQELLQRWPACRVLLVESGGHQVSLFELRPHRTALGEMSLDELVHVVTTLARDPRPGAIPMPPHVTRGSTGTPNMVSIAQPRNWNRREPMNEQSGNYDARGKSDATAIAELVAAVQAIHADLSLRSGAPAPDVQKAIKGAQVLMDFFNNGLSLVSGSQTRLPADIDEFLKVLNPDAAASA